MGCFREPQLNVGLNAIVCLDDVSASWDHDDLLEGCNRIENASSKINHVAAVCFHKWLDGRWMENVFIFPMEEFTNSH